MPRTKKKKIRKYCSPFARKESNMTCFTKTSLLKIAKAWNKENPNNKVKTMDASINVLWKRISKKLKEKCNHEWCWAQQQFIKDIKDKEISNTFKPRKPKKWNTNKTEWLSTVDIENVVKQYEKKYKNFRFIGAVPIDFDSTYGFGHCIVNELCKINLEKLILNKIFQVGIVFNLDKHDQDGSHWVGMFIDLKKNGIYYFDSYGEPEPKEVKELANRLLTQGKKIGKNNMVYKVNNIRHQYKNSECGIYCINFIVEMLKGTEYDEFIKEKINDVDMNKKRDFYFSPNYK
jgi:hypothetical protein